MQGDWFFLGFFTGELALKLVAYRGPSGYLHAAGNRADLAVLVVTDACTLVASLPSAGALRLVRIFCFLSRLRPARLVFACA